VRAEAYVFLPVAKRHWQEKEMNRRWASAEELQAIRAARPNGVVVRLYNPAAGEAEEAPVLAHAHGEGVREALEAVLAAFRGRWRIDATGAPRLAICTHGTRDRCCAKWGFAAYQTARRLFETGRSPFAPIECSHLGGDRFAATGIFFPSGSMYAHLDAVDLAGLAAAEAAGRLDPAIYRGRVFDPPLAQLARAGLAAAGELNDAAAPIVVVERGQAEIEAEIAGRRFRLRLGEAEVRFFGSCAHLTENRASRGRRPVVTRVERA
jgi:hypothetical protein